MARPSLNESWCYHWMIRFCILLASLNLSSGKVLRIGSRSSPLALAQARLVSDAITEANPFVETEIVGFNAKGDSKGGVQDAPLALQAVDFTGTLDDALHQGDIDLAVHSLKDIPPSHRWEHCEEFVISCPLPREDPSDALLGPYDSISSIPSGCTVGTSSIRRQAQLRSISRDIKVVNIRGNLKSRLAALEDGSVDALVLANAGLNRQSRVDQSLLKFKRTIVPPTALLPGLCQGIVAAVAIRRKTRRI